MATRHDLGLDPGKALGAPTTKPAATGMVLGANGLWVYPPGFLLAADLGRTPANSVAEESLLAGNAALSSLIPAAASVGDAVHVRAHGWVKNNTGTSTLTSRLRVYWGSVAAFDRTSNTLTSGATARAWAIDVWLMVAVVGDGTSGRLRVLAIDNGWTQAASMATMGGTGYSAVPASAAEANDASSANAITVATNAAASFNITATMSSASASFETGLGALMVRWYPKN